MLTLIPMTWNKCVVVIGIPALPKICECEDSAVITQHLALYEHLKQSNRVWVICQTLLC